MSQELERVYTINLGKVLLSPDNQRAKRAINMIKEFARHHMKIEDIKIEEDLSHKIWSRGIRSPPRKIRVRMTKTDEGFVLVTPYEEEIEKIFDKKKEKLDEKISEETKVDEVKEEAKPKKEEAKPKKEEAKPKKEEAKPKKEEAKPKKEEAKPKKEEAKPKKEEAKPKKEAKKESKPKKSTK